MVRATGVNDNTRKPKGATNLGSKELTEPEPTSEEPAWD